MPHGHVEGCLERPRVLRPLSTEAQAIRGALALASVARGCYNYWARMIDWPVSSP